MHLGPSNTAANTLAALSACSSKHRAGGGGEGGGGGGGGVGEAFLRDNGCMKSICESQKGVMSKGTISPTKAGAKKGVQQKDINRKRANTAKVVLRFQTCVLNTLSRIINVAQSSPVAAGMGINLHR